MLVPARLDCLLVWGTVLWIVGCKSHEENVCENVAACAEGGDSDWIARCKDEAKLLRNEASAASCGTLFDDYYACADSNFTCQGATALLPGCDGQRTTLEACLNRAEATNACGVLAAKVDACSPDAGDGGTGLGPACTIERICEAQCYLDSVSNVCAPAVNELSEHTQCAASCPP
jgi:hypothetical protein